MASSRLSKEVNSKFSRSSADSRRRNSSKLRVKVEGGLSDGTAMLSAIKSVFGLKRFIRKR